MPKWLFAALLLCLWLPALAFANSYKIDDVQIAGNRRVERSAIFSVISIKPGSTATDADIDQDVRALYKLGRFENVFADLEQRGAGFLLTYRLEERPLVRKFTIEGNKELKLEKLQPLVTLKTPGIYNPKDLRDSVEAIKKAYRDEGYYAAQVEAKVDVNADNEATVKFVVTENEKVLIKEINFEGNTVFTADELRKVMESKEKWWLSWLTGRGAYNEDLIQNDLEIIADQYYNKGYVQVRVKQPSITLTDDNRYMNLLIEIDEGEQFRVGELNVRGDLIEPADDILKLVKLKPGDVFSRELLRKGVFAVNVLYADQGYAYVNVSPLTRLRPAEKLINLMLEIEKGVKVNIERIEIKGNTKTRDKVIRREMDMVEGDLYNASKIKSSRSKINNLGFFDEVNVTTAKGSDESKMDVDVQVKERPTGTFSIGFGYSSVDGFIGQGSISQDNFLGRALRLNLAGTFGGKSTTYQVGILDPYFLDSKVSLGFDVYKTDREYTEFSKKTTGGDLKFGYPFSYKTRLFLIYRYEEKELYNVDPFASRYIKDQEGKSTLSSIFASISWNTFDYRPDPTSGYRSELSVEYAGLGGTENFAKYIADHRHFFPFKWGTYFSVHGQIGYAQKTGGDDIPIDERFYLGGINSLRGFNSREVGPRVKVQSSLVNADGTVSSVYEDDYEYIGGDKEAYFNFEYYFPLIKEMGLKGLVFFDTGNAWGEDQDFFESMRYSVGTGIRWFSPMGPLRLEWGYNLDPLDGEKNSQFEFSLGKFF